MALTDLVQGALSGKDCYLYYNSGTYASPTWVEIKRARNITFNLGSDLNDVEFHGSNNGSQIVGYSRCNGSFEYVRKAGGQAGDSVYAFLYNAMMDAEFVDICCLDGEVTSGSHKGWRVCVYLGQFAQTANGGDAVVESIPFGRADAYDQATGAEIEVTEYTGAA